MDTYRLPPEELVKLQAEHRLQSGKRFADRVKAVYLLGSGWRVKDVAEALLLDEDTVRAHFKRYREGGMEKLCRHDAGGSAPWLNPQQLQALDKRVTGELHLTAAEIACFVGKELGVWYSVSGMTKLLHRLGFSYKKPEIVPWKADGDEQEKFLEELAKLKGRKKAEDPIYYMDATHPQHGPIAGYGWIKKGKTHKIPSNTGRKRLNINGAFNVETMCSIVRYDDTINSQSTIALFGQLEEANPQAEKIYVVCDNAGYYRSGMVEEYLEDSKIELIFLPIYSPNLNLIERYWKFFKRKILYGIHYETFGQFKNACEWFFANTAKFEHELRSLMVENFQIIRWETEV